MSLEGSLDLLLLEIEKIRVPISTGCEESFFLRRHSEGMEDGRDSVSQRPQGCERMAEIPDRRLHPTLQEVSQLPGQQLPGAGASV